jgi:hypothetical protein
MRIWGIGIGDWAVVGAVAEEAGFFFRERGVVAEDSGVVAATCWFAGEGRDKRTYIPKIRKRETVSKIFFIDDNDTTFSRHSCYKCVNLILIDHEELSKFIKGNYAIDFDAVKMLRDGSDRRSRR